ncbi:MAG TPA: hypothetical protein VMG31_08955 [Verrucomicrobiae bacterium]|nr:hypothetical protein [Verrucomicrobiae bacterium]
MASTKWLAWSVLFLSSLVFGQAGHTAISVTAGSNISSEDLQKVLSKVCPNANIISEESQSDYSLEAIKKTTRPHLSIEHITEFDLTLFDHDGNTFTSVADSSLRHGFKELCRDVGNLVPIEVVDTRTLTFSSDTRGDTSGGIVGTVVNSETGRRTHTDESSIYVIVRGEHALLDCYERHTGCSTMGPRKYYGRVKGDGIWVSYRMPITHQPVQNHYKLAGSW